MSSKQYPLVSIITVNYNQATVTMEWLQSIQQISYPNIEIIIVDNASADNLLEELLLGQEHIKYIKSYVNRGFAGGNNLGIAEATGDLLLFLNNDTEVTPRFLEPLVECIQNNPKAGMVSPKIVYFYQKNTIQYAGGSKINPITGRGKFIGSGEPDDHKYSITKATELIHGAAMLVPRKVVNMVGLMHEVFFLYYEELDWCERVKRAGYKVYIAGTSVVYHKESVSVGKNSPVRTFYTTRNRLLFMQRNFPGLQFTVHLLFFFLIAVPKNICSLALKRRLDLLQAFIRGVFAYIVLAMKPTPIRGIYTAELKYKINSIFR